MIMKNGIYMVINIKLIFIILIFSSTLFAQEKSNELKPYTAISVGYGNSYGSLGIMVETTGKKNTMALHCGLGYFASTSAYGKHTIFYSAGLKFFLTADFFKDGGYYLDLQFGSLGVQTNEEVVYTIYSSGYKIEVEEVILFGPSLLFGNTYWLGSRVGINIALGISVNMVELDWTENYTLLPAADFGISFRL